MFVEHELFPKKVVFCSFEKGDTPLRWKMGCPLKKLFFVNSIKVVVERRGVLPAVSRFLRNKCSRRRFHTNTS